MAKKEPDVGARKPGEQKKGADKPAADLAPEEETTSLTVTREAHALVKRAAGANGLTVKAFFENKKVRTFLRHMIASAAEEEQAKEDQPPAGPPSPR